MVAIRLSFGHLINEGVEIVTCYTNLDSLWGASIMDSVEEILGDEMMEYRMGVLRQKIGAADEKG